MIIIDEGLLVSMQQEAKSSSRKRAIKNYHAYSGDLLQRMVNAMEPGTYVQPHKHENPDKREVFILLKGKVVIVEFDDHGAIISSSLMSRENGRYAVEIAPGVWHTIIPLESSVLYEVKDGPYDPANDKCFAGWAPAEGESETKIYNDTILKKLNLQY